MATPTDIAAAKAFGYVTPTGNDLIRNGDDAITENAVLSFFGRYFKGILTAESDLDALENGTYFSPSAAVSTALGLPVPAPGQLDNLKIPSGVGLQTFKTWGQVTVTKDRRRTSSGWLTWDYSPVGAIRTIVSIHGNLLFDDLPDGDYFNAETQLQTLWGLPAQVGKFRKDEHSGGYGIATFVEWATPNRRWVNRRTTTGWQGWTLESSGSGSMEIKLLSADQDMQNLPDGMYNAPNSGVALSLGLPGGLPGGLVQIGSTRNYTNSQGMFVSSKGSTVWGGWAQAGVEDGYTPLQPPTGLPWNQVDTDAFTGFMLDQDHHGSGYAINTQNFPGAGSGWVGHQYSNANPFMIIDNCRSQPSIRINNTQNSTITPEYQGNGDFFQLGPWDSNGNYSRWFTLTNYLEFRNDTRQTPSFNQIYGTGDILEFRTGSTRSKITRAGAFEALSRYANPILVSPNGSRFQLTVSDAGALTTTAL